MIAVSAGYNHSVALRGDGRVVCWGDNAAGQLVGSNEAANVTAVAAGASFTLLRTRGPVVTVHPSGAPVIPGGTLGLQADARADSSLQFQWEKDGQDIAGATENSLSLTNLQLGMRAATARGSPAPGPPSGPERRCLVGAQLS